MMITTSAAVFHTQMTSDELQRNLTFTDPSRGETEFGFNSVLKQGNTIPMRRTCLKFHRCSFTSPTFLSTTLQRLAKLKRKKKGTDQAKTIYFLIFIPK